MIRRLAAAMLVAAFAVPSMAQDAAPAKQMRRWGGLVQVEASQGGRDLYDGEQIFTHMQLGEGVALSAGGFYRLHENSPFELQFIAGYKAAWFAPVTVGPQATLGRWQFQLLANYRNHSKWYVSGGLIAHTSIDYSDDVDDSADISFDNALGATIEGGWNWVGFQCTYMEYSAGGYGSEDASNCGIRFTFRFRKWHPPQ